MKLLISLMRKVKGGLVSSYITKSKRIKYLWLSAISKSTWCTKLHFVFISNAMDFEAKAVVAGQVSHENRGEHDSVNYSLRRAIHRIEKGLIMRPAKSHFALDYIEDTVQQYKEFLDTAGGAADKRWAFDVLTAYFNVVKSNAIVDKQRALFESLPEPNNDQNTRVPHQARVPYKATDKILSTVSYEEFSALAMQRRSVRWYKDKEVPRILIDKAMIAAAQSPSACNRQPFRFLVFDDKESVLEVSKLPMGVKGFNHNFPVIIAVVGRLRAYSDPRDRHAIYIDAALASMTLMYALETLGLSSCSINWPDIKAKEIAARKLLKLEPDERIIMFISVGYADPDGLIPYSEKSDLQQLRKYTQIAVNNN